MNTARIAPKNLTAQQTYKARGNPPATLPESAISNCFPGLEFDFRNIWKHLFVGIELLEAGAASSHWVVSVEEDSAADQAGIRPFDTLIEVDGNSVAGATNSPNQTFPLEYGNSLAEAVQKGTRGESAQLAFDRDGTRLTATVPVRNIFEGAALSESLAEPGAMTQGLCSPWQTDYRECGCFYWAASRPDFVNAESDGSGNVSGHSWMQSDRTPGASYVPDTLGNGPGEISYEDLYRSWEQVLRFVIHGRDETAINVTAPADDPPAPGTPDPADNGFRWRPTSTRRRRRHDDIWFFDANNGWAVNSDGRFIKTENGGDDWNDKFHARRVYPRCIGFTTRERGWVGTLTATNRLYSTTDGGDSWNPVDLPDGAPDAICGMTVVNESVIYASGTNFPNLPAGIIKTTDRGNSWQSIDMGDHATLLVDIYFKNENEGWVVGGKAPTENPFTRNDVKPVILFTADGGDTWNNVVTDDPDQLPNGEWGWKIFFVNEDIGYVSLENFDAAAVMKTTDGGQSFSRLPVVDQQGNANLEGIGFINPDTGWVGGWGDRDFIGGFSSATNDGGDTWRDANEIGRFINRFRFIGDPLEVGYASGDLVYKYAREAAVSPAVESVRVDRLIPEDAPTESARPIRIPFNVPRGATQASIDIWSRFGEHVCELLDEANPEPGPRSIEWRGTRGAGEPLPPGHYLYRVTIDDESESRVIRLGE